MNKKKGNVLFLLCKWCDAKPSLSLNAERFNFTETFCYTCKDYNYNVLHPDECVLIYNAKIDDILPKFCLENNINILFVSLLNAEGFNPNINTFKKIKELGVFTCVFWPDTSPVWGLKNIESMGPDVVDLHVVQDCPRGPYHHGFSHVSNCIELWTPQDEYLFHPENNKTIDVSFMGSVDKYRDRMGSLDALKQLGAFVSGGQRVSGISLYEYAEIIRRSKISINFALSQTGVFYQSKNRIFEITASETMLMDVPNLSTDRFFVPNLEYIPFNSIRDLSEKLRYYKEHEDECRKVAIAGRQKYVTYFSTKQFWDKLLSIIEEKLEK